MGIYCRKFLYRSLYYNVPVQNCKMRIRGGSRRTTAEREGLEGRKFRSERDARSGMERGSAEPRKARPARSEGHALKKN